VGSIPLFKILKKKIISIAAALDLACADIIILQNNKNWDAPCQVLLLSNFTRIAIAK
jgi:hypothetical protein